MSQDKVPRTWRKTDERWKILLSPLWLRSKRKQKFKAPCKSQACEGITFDCHICDYKAAYASQVKTHVMDKHEGIEYKCDVCEWETNEKSNKNEHKQITHKESE